MHEHSKQIKIHTTLQLSGFLAHIFLKAVEKYTKNVDFFLKTKLFPWSY